ncbi:hypothetical protein, partial [Vibrio parahaemolyticus]|uniref:hypothetical protein n=1 Tax=Vibrio parahaemolyticus TaxID=670 RepID=UPI0032B0071F
YRCVGYCATSARRDIRDGAHCGHSIHPTDEQLAKSVKGISEASASKIRAAIDEKIVQPWERENWTKEQVNEVRRK